MNKSVWFAENESTKFPRLTQNVKADVVIVGGGLAGIFCAYLLAKESKKVVIVEKDRIGSGQTSYTTAFITYVVDTSLSKIVEKLGEENAKSVWEAGKTGLTEIERIISQEKIECDFLQCNAYVCALNKDDANILKREASLAQKFGFDVSFKNDGNLSFKNSGYLEIHKQAKFHPLKFLYQLTEKAKEAGVKIFENTEALKVVGSNPIQVECESGFVEAEFAVIDTYNPTISNTIKPGKLISYQSYVTSFLINKDLLEEAIYWDTGKPYSYFRLDKFKKFDRLILGGRDHLTGQDPNPGKHFDELEKYFKKTFINTEYKVEDSWNGEILESLDGIPYIGQSPQKPSILLSTSFSGNGMTYAALSAVLNRDIIINRTNKYKALFNPERIGNIGEITKRESFSQTPEFNDEETSLNSGKVVEINNEKIAIYKDEAGNTHKLSPICTHLGCTVGWNDKEKTWDCPCHGSRYTKDGSVLNGPAKKPLKKL